VEKVNYVQDLIVAAGGQSSLARALGIKQQSVRKWVTRGAISPERTLAAIAATIRIRLENQWEQILLPSAQQLCPQAFTPVKFSYKNKQYTVAP